MQTEGFLLSIEKRFPWSFLGFLAGVIFGLFGIYSVFFYTKSPDLRAEILSSAPVLSISADVQDLDILFKGQNIRQSHQALTLVNLKLTNRGNVSITPGDFDPKDLPTIRLSTGDLVKADFINSSDTYLRKVFADTTITSQSIRFTPFIMEPGNYISLSLLILHNVHVTPTLTIQGKVANVPKIDVLPSVEIIPTPRKKDVAFAGDIAVQFLRIASYGLGTIAFIVGSITLYGVIRNWVTDNQRRRRRLIMLIRVEKFLESLDKKAHFALEPIARIMLSKHFTFSTLPDELISLAQSLKHYSPEMRNNIYLKMLLEDFKTQIPNFDNDNFIQSGEGMKQLGELLIVIWSNDSNNSNYVCDGKHRNIR